MEVKEFYEKVITFDKYVEFRIMNVTTGSMFSVWAENYSDVESIYAKYDKLPYNVYFGINTRDVKGRKDLDIDIRRAFYFDIEHEGTKPQLSNQAYKKELMETAAYISVELEKKYSIKPIAIVESGRGLHLYYRSYEFSREDYDRKFKIWFKEVQKKLDLKKPHKHIKFMDSVFNIGRIASAPGTHHNKYEEKPLRRIVKAKVDNICDMQNVLDAFKIPEYKPRVKEIIKDGKKRDVFKFPEFKIFEYKIPEMKGYAVHSKLRVALNLLMDKYGLVNREEVAQRLVTLGYWYEEMVPIENPDYVYSESILNNWCMDHWELCLEKGIKLPYPIRKNKGYGIIYKEEMIDYDVRELHTPWDIYYYVKNFNNDTAKLVPNKRTTFFPTAMKVNVLANIKSDDLLAWIKLNNYLEQIKVVL